jgi:hypothetical protein
VGKNYGAARKATVEEASSVDQFDFDDLRLPEEAMTGGTASAKLKKRQKQWIKLPFRWRDRLRESASGKIWIVATAILHQSWKAHGRPIALANEILEFDGVDRQSKRRALAELERLGLIVVERRPRKSPVIRPIIEDPSDQ